MEKLVKLQLLLIVGLKHETNSTLALSVIIDLLYDTGTVPRPLLISGETLMVSHIPVSLVDTNFSMTTFMTKTSAMNV